MYVVLEAATDLDATREFKIGSNLADRTYANHESMLNHIAFLFRRSMNFYPPAMQQLK